jgi:hypothetical protein
MNLYEFLKGFSSIKHQMDDYSSLFVTDPTIFNGLSHDIGKGMKFFEGLKCNFQGHWIIFYLLKNPNLSASDLSVAGKLYYDSFQKPIEVYEKNESEFPESWFYYWTIPEKEIAFSAGPVSINSEESFCPSPFIQCELSEVACTLSTLGLLIHEE